MIKLFSLSTTLLKAANLGSMFTLTLLPCLLASKVFGETNHRRKRPHNFLDLIFKEQVRVDRPDREGGIIHVEPGRSTVLGI